MFACFRLARKKSPPVTLYALEHSSKCVYDDIVPIANFDANTGSLLRSNSLFRSTFVDIDNISQLSGQKHTNIECGIRMSIDVMYDALKEDKEKKKSSIDDVIHSFTNIMATSSSNTPKTKYIMTVKKACGENILVALFVPVPDDFKTNNEIVVNTTLRACANTLGNLFPRHILESMDENGRIAKSKPRFHKHVVVLFMDLVGFTAACDKASPTVVVEFLNKLFNSLDALAQHHNVYKLETVGDCYVVVCGLFVDDDPDKFDNTIRFAFEAVQEVRRHKMATIDSPFHVRIGIHSGPVTSGVISDKMPRFSLFGDTMNTASRMESTGKPGCIQVSQSVYEGMSTILREKFSPRDTSVFVKGKGMMPTFICSLDNILESPYDDVKTFL